MGCFASRVCKITWLTMWRDMLRACRPNRVCAINRRTYFCLGFRRRVAPSTPPPRHRKAMARSEMYEFYQLPFTDVTQWHAVRRTSTTGCLFASRRAACGTRRSAMSARSSTATATRRRRTCCPSGPTGTAPRSATWSSGPTMLPRSARRAATRRFVQHAAHITSCRVPRRRAAAPSPRGGAMRPRALRFSPVRPVASLNAGVRPSKAHHIAASDLCV